MLKSISDKSSGFAVKSTVTFDPGSEVTRLNPRNCFTGRVREARR